MIAFGVADFLFNRFFFFRGFYKYDNYNEYQSDKSIDDKIPLRKKFFYINKILL